jgi:hypothetical protein
MIRDGVLNLCVMAAALAHFNCFTPLSPTGPQRTSVPCGWPFLAAFRQGLRDTGFVEGRNVTIEGRFGDDHYERLPNVAAESSAGSPSSPAILADLTPRKQ